MRIAVASGKGGTGKTTIATNMALSIGKVQLIDCDVEEPNCHLFLDLNLEVLERVYKKIPSIDKQACNLCGVCSEVCRKNAIAVLPNDVLFFEELCNGCGGCARACPTDAITEESSELGVVEGATINGLQFFRGLLNVGQPMATPIIAAVKRRISEDTPAIVDVPPGTGCPVLESLRKSDFAILVTEPTPFGLEDLKAAVGVTRAMKIMTGVIINRVGIGDDRVNRFCKEEGIPIILEIPESREIAEAYSEGIPFTEVLPEWKDRFRDLYSHIKELVG
jgi:MinD superfamily P-loop ATPase